MDLELRHLRLVREVSATGSLTKAGSALHLTQSALSHQLNDIESRLGTRLFLRVGKRMVLTPAGERVLQSADSVLAMIERTEDAVRQFSGATRGVLRIATECCTCYHWLPSLLGRYRRAHPQVDVRIELAATSDPLAHILEGRLDVAIVSGKVRDR
jgi:LysR family transcriptional regulator, regulator for metE and metH